MIAETIIAVVESIDAAIYIIELKIKKYLRTHAIILNILYYVDEVIISK